MLKEMILDVKRNMKINFEMIKYYIYPIAFGFLWLSAILFNCGQYIFGVTALISCIALLIPKIADKI